MGRPKGSKNKAKKEQPEGGVKERKRRRTKKEMEDARTLEAMRGQREAKSENGNEEVEERLPAPPPPVVKYDSLEATITGRYSIYDTGAWVVKAKDEHGMEVHPFYLHGVIKDILDTTNLSSSAKAIAKLVTTEEFGKYLLKVISKKLKEGEVVGSDIVIKAKDLDREEIIKLARNGS